MKSLMQLWQTVLDDVSTGCCTSTDHDLKKAMARFKHEGESFLTITLTNFGGDFQKSLDQGFVDPCHFLGFSRKGGLPRFLGGFLDLVFDRATGRLLDVPSIDAIFAIRQLTLMFGKILLPCSEERVSKAIDGYIVCEQEIRETDLNVGETNLLAFKRISRLLFADIFAKVDHLVYQNKLVPKHGPGSTAEKVLGNSKYVQKQWTARLESIFPYGEYAIPSWRYFEYLDCVDFLEPGQELPVRVVTVPKTLKTPRIIAIEPVCMQYTQQAIAIKLVQLIEQDSILSRLIGFTDQTVNQRLACQGSVDGHLATLDLSEASDRVSNQLVRLLFANHPFLAEGVDASRSRKADVPGYGVQRLAKFASMGSALCFPVEAMVFTTLCFLGIERALNRPLTKEDVVSFFGQVRVYGDDIIVPVDTVRSVVSTLETFGFRVNAGKSFWTGKFRESCGRDYYAGSDVTLVRARRVFPTRRKHVSEIVSLYSLRNQFYKSGLWKTAAYLDNMIVGLGLPNPVVLETSSLLGRHSFLGYESKRMHKTLHTPLAKGYVVRAVVPPSHLEGHHALTKVFLTSGVLPNIDRNHLERAGRPKRVDIKLGWTSAV